MTSTRKPTTLKRRIARALKPLRAVPPQRPRDTGPAAVVAAPASPPVHDPAPAPAPLERTPSGMDEVRRQADVFAETLQQVKAQGADFPWYPYQSMHNVGVLDQLLTGERRDLFQQLRGKRIADIGAADGDIAFLMESLGCRVDIIDNGPTNMNQLRGAALVKQRLNSRVEIHSVDLDQYFTLPAKYDFAFFMGILYHLQNPFYVMKTLARNTRTIVLSTRIASHPPMEYVTGDADPGYRDVPLAYLLDADESNGDSTNYWTFTEGGLKRLLKRTGWEVLDYITIGEHRRSDPRRDDRDQRAFCFLRSTAYED
ncbi:methyltransferase domain-containing protein [Brevundimonas sp. VNH65]|uniref:methyltransferase domain-containing protein n=1 Tax=Brevundimonas sp. VNH65 TaxID=3400917 RepID=UPI003BFEED0B